MLIFALLLLIKRSPIDQNYRTNDQDDDVRENIISYDDEGGGEDDMQAFDITPLRIPVDPSGGSLISARQGKQANIFNKPGGILKDLRKPYDSTDPIYGGDMDGSAAHHFGGMDATGVRLVEASDAEGAGSRPLDDLRNYAYEGCGSTAGSLSSLASIGQHQHHDPSQQMVGGMMDPQQGDHLNANLADNFDYLNRLGPRFEKLAYLYGQPGHEHQQ